MVSCGTYDFIHLQLMETSCIHFLATVSIQISLPLNIYPVRGLLNHIVVLFLIFLGTSILCPIIMVIFSIATAHLQGLQFLCIF